MDKYEKLNETFDVEPIDIKPEKNAIEKRIERYENSKEDVRKDYEYTRGNLYSIIEKGQEAINGILELAQEKSKGPTTVNNALFVGSTADLQKMLKNAGKDLNT